MLRARCRRVGKWFAAAATLAICVVCLASERWGAMWDGRVSDRSMRVWVGAGTLHWFLEAPFVPPTFGFYERFRLAPMGFVTGVRAKGQNVSDRRWLPEQIRDRSGTAGALPLWIPFVLITIPTALLWRLDRLRLPGHCPKCNYDLTGNTSGLCPECGRPVRA